jgi:hypothetical protein
VPLCPPQIPEKNLSQCLFVHLKFHRKTCPSASLSTTNSTRTTLGANPGMCNIKPVTDRLCSGRSIVRTSRD